MTTRIYLVTDTETNKHRLIRASNQAQAIKYASSTRFASGSGYGSTAVRRRATNSSRQMLKSSARVSGVTRLA